MKKFLSILFIALLVSSYSNNSKAEEVKDCFEGLNRATFALNQGLDKVIFEPIAKGYRKLPIPIRTGTSNVLSNLSNLITIPNNVLQGDLKAAGLNTARLTVNTTIGIFGIFVHAQIIKFSNNTLYSIRLKLMNSYQKMNYVEFANRNRSEYIYAIQTVSENFSSKVLESSLMSSLEHSTTFVRNHSGKTSSSFKIRNNDVATIRK